jgi:hypothetical protein
MRCCPRAYKIRATRAWGFPRVRIAGNWEPVSSHNKKQKGRLLPPAKKTRTMLPFPPASFRAGPALVLAAILLGLSGRAARAQSCFVNVLNLLDGTVQATVFNGGDSQYDGYYTQADIAASGCKCDIILQGCAQPPPAGCRVRHVPNTPPSLFASLTLLHFSFATPPRQGRTLAATAPAAAWSRARGAGGGSATARGA